MAAHKYTFRRHAWCFMVLAVSLAVTSCVPSPKTGPDMGSAPVAADAATVVATGARRADPGYIQYLERLSMLGSQTELARVVSGSQLAWLKPAGEPFPEPLLALADTWLYINPLTLLPETKRTVFASLASPQYWQIFNKSRIGGLYIAPTSGSGALWAYNRKASATGEDVIQYTFSESAGQEDDYFRLLNTANTNKKLLGLELTPATTGLGPDFFLAARYHRQFAGAYCMVELPQQTWQDLPVPADQWQGMPLTDDQTAALAALNLLPPAMAQDFLPTGKKGGWAVTGEVYGVDGMVRRWAYRYYGSADKPVLNWEDPSSGARRIISGSAIRNVGLLGGALIGLRFDGLYGLDAASPGTPPYFEPFPGNDAVIAVSREVRRYGGWTWLQDDLPLSAVLELMAKGPEFLRDTIFSPGVEHAVLTGSTALLEALVDDALMLGLDLRRFVHATTAEHGVDYALPHLAEAAAGNTAASLLSPAAAETLRDTALKEAQTIVYGATLTSPRGEDKPPLSGRHLNTTSAGIAALALGAGNEASVSREMVPQIRDGHHIQLLVKAMLPGIFMVSGQDMAGSLPLSWYAMTDNPAEWDGAIASRSAYALTQTVQDTAVTLQGIPPSRTIYERPDAQTFDEDSFISRFSALMGIRSTYHVAYSRLHGRFETVSPGCFAYALILPKLDEDNASPTGPQPDPDVAQALLQGKDGRKLSLAERRKQEHEKNERVRKELQRKIITAPNMEKLPESGDAALIVVVNFSGNPLLETLNLGHDPLLQRIGAKGAPVLLTKSIPGETEAKVTMNGNFPSLTFGLAPWTAAIVRIGSH